MSEEIPPWLKERLARFEETQRNLQSVQIQKRQVELEINDVEHALTELKKTAAEDFVYRFSGQILIKVNKDELLTELEEKLELDKTRTTILARQDEKLKQSLAEIQSKISGALSNQPNQGLKES